MRAFVIARDRVTYAQQCVDALKAAGLEVVFVDHGSTWPPMGDWLSGLRGADIWYCSNRHPRDLWAPGGAIERWTQPGERFIVTDCDVVPDPACPPDWVQLLDVLLDLCPAAAKAGLGLRTDDLPEHYAHRDQVQAWEANYQRPQAPWVVGTATIIQPPAVWADVDTTFAMYRRFEPFRLGPAVRTTSPYWARHLTWYEDTANPTPEQAYYRRHAQYGHWRNPDGYTDAHGLGGSS